MLVGMRKAVITFGIIGIIVGVLIAMGPVVNTFFGDEGLRTASVTTGGEPATTDVNGTWTVIPGEGSNQTQAGYTFHEILPGQSKSTSGRADNQEEQNISGHLTVDGETVTEGVVTVRVDGISSDQEKRDINVRREIFETDKYPNASFTLTEPVDVSSIPDDGTPGEATVTGDVEIHGQSNSVTAPMTVLRTADKVILSANIPINRLDFGVETPDFVAAQVDEEGTLDVLLVLSKRA